MGATIGATDFSRHCGEHMALTASQRITMMGEISKRLGDEGYPLIDATLKVFGIKIQDNWNGAREDYVLSMLDGTPEPKLIELAQHVGFDFPTHAVNQIDPPFWQPGAFRVFISHLSAHRAFTGELKTALLEYGISCFVAHDDIEPTLEWQTQIETALATCDALVALLHSDFHKSNWTDQEIGFAMGRALPIYSIRFGQDPYGFIGRFQAFSGNNKNPAQLARELFDVYRKNKQTQSAMANVLIKLFETSSTFANAKKHVGYLEELEIWDSSFSTRIQTAVENNGQIDGSWGVPERVAGLVKKWEAVQ